MIRYTLLNYNTLHQTATVDRPNIVERLVRCYRAGRLTIVAIYPDCHIAAIIKKYNKYSERLWNYSR